MYAWSQRLEAFTPDGTQVSILQFACNGTAAALGAVVVLPDGRLAWTPLDGLRTTRPNPYQAHLEAPYNRVRRCPTCGGWYARTGADRLNAHGNPRCPGSGSLIQGDPPSYGEYRRWEKDRVNARVAARKGVAG